MTPDHVRLVQDSFAKVEPIADRVAELFYGRLFEIAPQLRALFPDDMAEQRRKLMGTLAIMVNGLADLPGILPGASALAKRHVGYGVKAADYPTVGVALLWTLEKRLGGAWTPELAAAWTATYTTLSDYMISEAYGEKSA